MRRLANSPSRSSREWARLVRDAAPVRIFTGVEELLRELDEAKDALGNLFDGD